MTPMDRPSGLTQTQRSALETLVRDLRRLLEIDLRSTAEGRFGLHPDGQIEPNDALTLTAIEQADRDELMDVLSHLRELGESPADAIARIIREAAFTHVNRFLAIRVAEAIGVLPESLAQGTASEGFSEIGEVAPLVSDDYLGYLDLCAGELAADAPVLFDPRNPMLRLPMSAPCATQAVEMIGKVDPELWASADTFGWAYQFFNSEDERREMREASSAPRSSRELAVRNQFFTPRYVVDFLVQNTLGRRLLPSMPALAAHLPLLLDPPTAPGLPVDLRDIKVLDPASGSGHFLLGAYDLLEIAWAIQGVTPEEAAPHIVKSLWGVDIDPRCTQVAAAAVVMRARRRTLHGELPRPNIICARGLPENAHLLVPGLEFEDAQLLQAVEEALADAPKLGVLLRAEERIDIALDKALGSAQAPTLSGSMNVVEREQHLRKIVARLAEVEQASPAERLLAAEIDDTLRLWEVCRTRFTAVLMNPPFGEPIPQSKDYLDAAYPDCPGREILCAFVERGIELCAPDGFLGAITSRGPLFLKTGETWRQNTILGNRLTAMADLGFGVMEQAMVEAAAYVIAPRLSGVDQPATVIRLLKEQDRPNALLAAAENAQKGSNDSRVFHVSGDELAEVPGAPLAYWIDPALRRLFVDLPQIEGIEASARVGLQTGEDFRFVRLFWEVHPESIGRSRKETRQDKRWVPFAKGGDYSPYWADIHLVVDWQNDGQSIRKYEGSRPQNTQFFFRPGLTWSSRTNSSMAMRLLPDGCVFGHKGPALIGDEPLLHLAWLRSRVALALLEASLSSADETSSGGASRSYEVGIVQRLPMPTFKDDAKAAIMSAARRICETTMAADAEDETTRRFLAPHGISAGLPVADAAMRARVAECDRALLVLSEAQILDELITTTLGLPPDTTAYLETELGPSTWTYPMTPPTEEVLQDLARPLSGVIRETLASRGGARHIANMTYLADRQLEVLAHVHRAHPTSLAEAISEHQVLPDGEPSETANRRLSYLMGVAMGRWNPTCATTPDAEISVPDIFASPAVLPPAAQGLSSLAEGPFGLGKNGIALDEPGHKLDIVAALTRAAVEIWPHQNEQLLTDLHLALGHNSLREALRKGFWKDHLKRYSRSRRQAPVYWPLTVPSQQWGIWLYAPSLTRETLFAVAAETERRQRLSYDLVAQLASEQPGAGRNPRQIAGELAAERKLQTELGAFHTEAARIANLGWVPDLDDGYILCAAVMSKLLPQWKEAAQKMKELKAGKYDWSCAAEWAVHL